MKDYMDLFNARGSVYDRAMQHYPHAREQEFMQVIERARLMPGMVVGDVPAGGGYLQRYLPAGCTWQGHEPCASFISQGGAHSAKTTGTPLLPLPWRDASIDVAVSIAGVHHIEDKRPLFADLRRAVKPGGRLVLSDVAAGSAVAHFLDGYVGDNNSTGHEGVFLSQYTLQELAEAGWSVESCEQVDYHWLFDDRDAMSAFCHGLFDIRHSNLEATLAVIEAGLGTDQLDDGRIGMRWSLMTIVALNERPAA